MKPKRKRDWEGRYVRLKREIINGHGMVFSIGEVMKVTRNWGGLHLKAVIQCKHCHTYQRFVNKVHENSVVLLPEDYKP